MMKLNCPTCRTEFHPSLEIIKIYPLSRTETYTDDGEYAMIHEVERFSKTTCDHCQQIILFYEKVYEQKLHRSEELIKTTISDQRIIHPVEENPFNSEIKEIDAEIPEIYSCDYRESILVSKVSPKASAALSRRLLQKLLHEKFEIRKGNLSKEIDEFIKTPHVPSNLASDIDAIRQIGNFAAHPTKDKHSGEIVDVEAGEAEWLLDVLGSLFDFAFVQPAKSAQRRQALNEKLKAHNKPELKNA